MSPRRSLPPWFGFAVRRQPSWWVMLWLSMAAFSRVSFRCENQGFRTGSRRQLETPNSDQAPSSSREPNLSVDPLLCALDGFVSAWSLARCQSGFVEHADGNRALAQTGHNRKCVAAIRDYLVCTHELNPLMSLPPHSPRRSRVNKKPANRGARGAVNGKRRAGSLAHCLASGSRCSGSSLTLPGHRPGPIKEICETGTKI